MLSINELKQGRVIQWNNEPYIILEYQHARTAQRRAFVRTKLRNIITGATLEKTFNASDKVEEADLSRQNANYLYSDGNNHYFMNEATYEEIGLSKEQIPDAWKFLKEGTKVIVLCFNNNAVNIELPKKITLKILETEPAVRGDTVSGNVTKRAKLETGYEVGVPIFINQGEDIVVNTETEQYVERASK